MKLKHKITGELVTVEEAVDRECDPREQRCGDCPLYFLVGTSSCHEWAESNKEEAAEALGYYLPCHLRRAYNEQKRSDANWRASKGRVTIQQEKDLLMKVKYSDLVVRLMEQFYEDPKNK